MKNWFVEIFKMIWSTKISYFTIFNIFRREKKLFEIFNTEIFIFFALNQLNILIYSKTEFLQKYTVRNR